MKNVDAETNQTDRLLSAIWIKCETLHQSEDRQGIIYLGEPRQLLSRRGARVASRERYFYLEKRLKVYQCVQWF